MILVTGPTGSGKTTTLYTLIKMLNSNEISIVTIEDPIEYAVDGVEQIQVNHRTGLTFANGLRSILRQDPNVIMVGEIRDTETAGIAVNTALTGHLLLSTLHTNDVSTTLPRLL
jgi:type IV pilus assembly protein PilB